MHKLYRNPIQQAPYSQNRPHPDLSRDHNSRTTSPAWRAASLAFCRCSNGPRAPGAPASWKLSAISVLRHFFCFCLLLQTVVTETIIWYNTATVFHVNDKNVAATRSDDFSQPVGVRWFCCSPLRDRRWFNLGEKRQWSWPIIRDTRVDIRTGAETLNASAG